MEHVIMLVALGISLESSLENRIPNVCLMNVSEGWLGMDGLNIKRVHPANMIKLIGTVKVWTYKSENLKG